MSAALAWYDGVTRTVEFSSQTALWYHAGKPPVPIRWVLIRDPLKQFDSQALLCTDTAVVPVQIIEWFVLRWQIEVTFQEARAHLGVETQRQWSDRAIARTTPILLGLFSWITLAAHLLGNQCLGTPRSAAWYAKSEPTFVDAIALVRRHLWNASATFCTSPQKPGYATNPDAAVQQVHRIAGLCSLNVQSRAKSSSDFAFKPVNFPLGLALEIILELSGFAIDLGPNCGLGHARPNSYTSCYYSACHLDTSRCGLGRVPTGVAQHGHRRYTGDA